MSLLVWVKNYTMAHIKLGEHIKMWCTIYDLGIVGNDN